jgi:maltodextrin utilization protein YvdJ
LPSIKVLFNPVNIIRNYFYVFCILSMTLLSLHAHASPSSPSSVRASISNGDDITISWSRVSGATYYHRQVSTSGSAWRNQVRYTTTSVTFTNQSQRSYQYRVRACDNSGCSGWRSSNTVTITNLPPIPSKPNNMNAAISGGNDITISWSSVSGATYYNREVRLNGGAWQNQNRYTTTSVTFTNQSQRRYQYRIRACNTGGCSSWRESNQVTVVSPPAIPASASATIKGGNDITISWSSVSGATYYNREVSLNGDAWQNQKSYTTTSVTFTDQSSQSYHYRVRACNTGGCSSWRESNQVTVVAPPAIPASVSATIAGGNDITISWSSVSGATYYHRQVSTSSSAWKNQNEYTTTSVTFTDQSPQSYQYRVRACNTGGCSSWVESNQVSVFDNDIIVEVLWEEASVSIAEEVTLNWDLTGLTNCHFNTNPSVMLAITGSKSYRFYQFGTQSMPIECTHNGQPVRYAPAIQVNKLAGPTSLREANH